MVKAATKEAPGAKLEQELAKLGLASMLKRVDELVDMDVKCTSTGFKQLDDILHPDDRPEEEWEAGSPNVGLPAGRDVEIFSREPEVGKTGLAMAIGASFQKQGKNVAIIDVARTITREFMDESGMITNSDTAEEMDLSPIYMMRTEGADGEPLTAEKVFDAVRSVSKIMDLVIVDDVPAMISEADYEKEAADNSRTGGISKIITDHLRKTTVKRACVMWINQQRQKIGFTMPGMPAKYQSMGGMAIPFFGSIRMDLRMVKKIEVGSGEHAEVVGMKVGVYTAKNKIAPPFRQCVLAYLNGEGFSPVWDWFELGQKLGVVEKSGSWFNLDGERLGAGQMNAYKALKESPEWQAKLRKLVNEALKK